MANDKTYSQQIAEISTQLKLSDIDQRTIDNAKIFMLDCLGCILSGSQIINAKVIRKSAQDISGDGPCTIFGTGAKVNPMMAALVNGTTGHSQDYDDDHREGTQHASVAVLPAVLALAEKYGKSGAEVLLEREANGAALYRAAADILRSPDKQARMKQGMLSLGIPDATERIYETVMALVK